MKDAEELGYERTNREKKMAPKSGLFWCWKCDRQIVSVGEKCPACGAKERKRTLKKETSA